MGHNARVERRLDLIIKLLQQTFDLLALQHQVSALRLMQTRGEKTDFDDQKTGERHAE